MSAVFVCKNLFACSTQPLGGDTKGIFSKHVIFGISIKKNLKNLMYLIEKGAVYVDVILRYCLVFNFGTIVVLHRHKNAGKHLLFPNQNFLFYQHTHTIIWHFSSIASNQEEARTIFIN